MAAVLKSVWVVVTGAESTGSVVESRKPSEPRALSSMAFLMPSVNCPGDRDLRTVRKLSHARSHVFRSVFAESGDSMKDGGACPTDVEVIVAAGATLALACGSYILQILVAKLLYI